MGKRGLIEEKGRMYVQRNKVECMYRKSCCTKANITCKTMCLPVVLMQAQPSFAASVEAPPIQQRVASGAHCSDPRLAVELTLKKVGQSGLSSPGQAAHLPSLGQPCQTRLSLSHCLTMMRADSRARRPNALKPLMTTSGSLLSSCAS